MNYHFNLDTLEQLTHLIHGQTIHLKEIQHDPNNHLVTIPFTRFLEPNADKYLVSFEQVSSLEWDPPSTTLEKNPQILKEFNFDPKSLVAKFLYGKGEVKVFLAGVRVVATGTLNPP